MYARPVPLKLHTRFSPESHDAMTPIESLPWSVAETTVGEFLDRVRADLGPTAVIEVNHDLLASLTCVACVIAGVVVLRKREHRPLLSFVLENLSATLIEETARVAIKHGFQVNTHAIGDRANREVLDIYERTFKANPDKNDGSSTR